MRYKITLQQLLNLTAAIEFMLALTPKHVVPELYTWVRNGGGKPSTANPACLGGWLPHIPHFAALGVRDSGYAGCPEIAYYQTTLGLSRDLFGVEWMFAKRNTSYQYDDGFHPAEIRRWQSMPEPTDHGLILLRLAHVIDNAVIRETS